jgi:ParB family chromosome partitioning protein
MGHARCLVNIDAVDKQLLVYKEIKAKELSVRQTEALVRNLYNNPKTKKPNAKTPIANTYQKIEDNIASQYGTRVKLKHHAKGHGSITFEYYSLEEFNKLLSQLNVTVS